MAPWVPNNELTGTFEGNDCLFPKTLELDVKPACGGGVCVYPRCHTVDMKGNKTFCCPWLPFYSYPCECGGCYVAVFGASIPLVLAQPTDKDTIMRFDCWLDTGMGFKRKGAAAAGAGAPPVIEMQR